MYKLLLCWRYLLTRYLALVCIISVMLGVGTLIVVNSVMSGFSTKLKDRLHGLLSDIDVESNSYEGFANPEMYMARIRESSIGDKIEYMTPTVEVFAIMQVRIGAEWYTKPVHLIGVNAEGRGRVGGFSEYLVRHKNAAPPTFAPDAEVMQRYRDTHPPRILIGLPDGTGEPPPTPLVDPDRDSPPPGAIIGYALGVFRVRDSEDESKTKDIVAIAPGDHITLMTASIANSANGGQQRIQPVRLDCIVTDYFKSEMSEYDSNYIFVPLEYIQQMRGMNDYGEHRVSSLQIKLKDYRDATMVVKELERIFPGGRQFTISTWEKKQGALLAAISIEKGILNLLLFMIIAVAGFGILAIFSMIVTEKTRDIGILKALGASNSGVMRIFLSYGLLLGVLGSALGTVLGLVFTIHINEIEKGLSMITGQEIFDRSVYYFDRIPTDIQPLNVVLVNLGAVSIAVLFSVLPALRASLLHPVRALRYE